MVLRTIRYGDSQLIVDMITDGFGRLSFMQRIPKTNRSKVKKQILQPLNILDIIFDYRPNIKMQRIKDASAAFPFMSIPFDPQKIAMGMFIAEFLYYATRSEQADKPLFRFIEDSMRWLDASTSACSNFHIVFLMHLTMFVGFYPNTEHDTADRYFDLRSGCFTPRPPLHSDFLLPDEADKIELLMRMSYATMHLFRFTREERNRCINIITKYYRLHVPDFPELKSLAVLREVFG